MSYFDSFSRITNNSVFKFNLRSDYLKMKTHSVVEVVSKVVDENESENPAITKLELQCKIV